MKKRKISGILKYGVRTYTPVQKLQEGGFVSVAKAYDWRDDPYELALMKQNSAQNIAETRANATMNRKKSSSSSDKPDKIDAFIRLEGGLSVTNDAINAEFSKLQEGYYNKIRLNEPGWVASREGQIEHQKIINEGKRLESKAKTEEVNFRDAVSKINSEDLQTYAISSDGGVMAYDKTSNKIGRIDMNTYLSGIDKYQILKLDRFVNWKENEDKSLQSGLTDEFLRGGALGYNSLRKNFIDGREDVIKYAFLNGSIIKKEDTTTGEQESHVLDTALFKKGLDNLKNGADFFSGMSVDQQQQTNKGEEVVNSIYSDIMGGYAMQSQLSASLEAEVLRDAKNLAIIGKLQGLEDREAYLENQKKILLVSKIVDKNLKASGKKAASTSGTDETSGSDATPKANEIMADLESFADNKDLYIYNIAQETTSAYGDRRVNDRGIAMIKGGLNQTELDLEFDPKASTKAKKVNNMKSNPAINKRTDQAEYYFVNGTNLKKAFGNNGDKVNDFIAHHTVISPYDSMPMFLIPMANDKEVVADQLNDMVHLKTKARQDFIKSMNGKKVNGKIINITTPANKLLPGNLGTKETEDIQAYQNWIRMGIEYKEYSKKAKEDPTAENITKSKIAYQAQETISEMSVAFVNKFGSQKIEMVPMQGTWIIFDDDKYKVKDNTKAVTKPGITDRMIKEASKEEWEFLRGVNGVDYSNGFYKLDHVYKTLVLNKVKGLNKISSEQGEKVAGVSLIQKISDRYMAYFSGLNIQSNPSDRSAIALFLLN